MEGNRCDCVRKDVYLNKLKGKMEKKFKELKNKAYGY